MSCLISSASPVAMVCLTTEASASVLTTIYHHVLWHPSLLNIQPVLVIHPHRSMHKECVSSPQQEKVKTLSCMYSLLYF